MRLLIDCTYIYYNPTYNTGIQRVVRNIIKNLPKTKKLSTSIPVILKDGLIYQVNYLIPRKQDNPIHEWIEETFLQKHSRARNILAIIFKIINKYIKPKEQITVLDVKPGDLFVILDASWNLEIFSQLSKLKESGLGVIGVIYDITPITNPEYCKQDFPDIFSKWIDGMLRVSDGFMFISQTVQAQVYDYTVGLIGKDQASKKWYDFFHLGNDLDLTSKNDLIRDGIKNIFNHQKFVFLMVGTIEPRKNHAYLIDVFDLLWDEGIDVTLCLVGRKGWGFEDILNRVYSNKEFNKRLFYINDATDSELDFCYKNSKSLLFPSHAEGFGLPIVESLQRGLPAMVSDLPVFREIGGEYLAYFDITNKYSLVALIKQFKKSGVFPALSLKDWSWISWEKATNIFIKKLVNNITE